MIRALTPTPTGRFTCSDCGRDRKSSLRYQCLTCTADVCLWCDERHHKQHPPETRRRPELAP